jgi:hypothetical protein
MVAVDAGEPGGSGSPAIIEARWDSQRLSTNWHDGSPVAFVSSGLGDALVEPRLALFEEMVVRTGATAAAQDEFHAHRWPDRPQVSVMMTRADARTVSVCRVEVDARPAQSPGWAVKMTYVPVPEVSVVAALGRAVRG